MIFKAGIGHGRRHKMGSDKGALEERMRMRDRRVRVYARCQRRGWWAGIVGSGIR